MKKNNEIMNNKLVDIATIYDLLGYTDSRSVEKWCKENKLPIMTIGMRKYTIGNFLEIFIEREMKIFIEDNFSDAEDILKAVKNDDKAQLIELMDATYAKKIAKKFIEKKKRSSAAETLLNKIKIA